MDIKINFQLKRDKHAPYTLQPSADFTEQQSGDGSNDQEQSDEQHPE